MPARLRNTLKQRVAERWPEVARFALDHCAEGYNRGYILMDETKPGLEYVVVPDRKQAQSESFPPLTLEESVLMKQNCEDYIVVALKSESLFVWEKFTSINGVDIRRASLSHDATLQS